MRTLIKKTMWPILSKPWNTADMEFHYGLWLGVSALYSESGRQLGEGNTRPFPLNHHVPAETISCKYAGSRNGKLINMSALRTAMQNYDAAVKITGLVRSQHLKHCGNAKGPGIWDLYCIARASIALVAYQHRFARQNPHPAHVSDVLTSQYQFISGVFMICRHMMDHADPVITENRKISANALYRYADEHGIFISFNDMACAGSVKKIMDFLEFCKSGAGQETNDLNLSDIVSEPDNWYQYAIATIELDCFIEAHRAQNREASANSEQAVAQKVGNIYRSVQRYCQQLMTDFTDPDGDFVQQALARQNRILALLGRKPITSLPTKHIQQRVGLFAS